MAPTKFSRKARPTNLDLQEQIAELHDCVHTVGDRVVEAEKTQARTAAKIEASHALTAAHVGMLAEAMGVKLPTGDEVKRGVSPKRIRRRLGGMNPWQVAAMAVPAITTSMALYKVLEPAIAAFVVTAHTALMHLP